MTDHYEINLIVVPTLICKNLINSKPNTSNPDNYISAMEAIFGDVTFSLNETQMNTIITAYDNLLESSVVITGESQVK